MTAQSASIPWKIESWQATIATHLLRQQFSPTEADRATCQLILALLWLYLWEQRGGVAPPLQSLQGDRIYAKFLRSLTVLHTRLGLANPFPRLTQFELDDPVLRGVVADLNQLELANPIACTILGQVYEQMLGRSIDSSAQRPVAASRKKSAGIYYTPPAIVQSILQSTLPRLLPGTLSPTDPPPCLRLLDPACGSGAFLVAAYQYLLDWYLQQYLQDQNPLSDQPALQRDSDGQWRLTQAERERILLTHLFGVDLDPQAVVVTQLCLWLTLMEDLPDSMPRSLPCLGHNIQQGNALIGSEVESQLADLCPLDWEKAFPAIISKGGFDLVLGNPPYIDSETMTLHLAEWRAYCGQHYRTAQGNWDLFCLFIEKAIALCRPGGITSLIVPNKLASARYARPARQILSQENQLLLLRDYSQVPVFAASVYPLVYVAQKTLPTPDQTVRCEIMQDLHQVKAVRSLSLHTAPPEAPWLLTPTSYQSNLLLRLQQTFPALSTIAQVTGAATVEEAYRIQPLICDHPAPSPADLRLVNSGTIDRYGVQWGKKRLRYLGQTYLHPVILSEDLARLPPKRYQQATQPKVIIAGMTRRLECALDQEGIILAGKSTSVILAAAIDLRYLLGLLNSQLLSVYFNHWFAGNRLQGGYFRVGPPQLRQLPICIPNLNNPSERGAYEQIIAWVDQQLELESQRQFPNAAINQSVDQAMGQIPDQPIPLTSHPTIDQTIHPATHPATHQTTDQITDAQMTDAQITNQTIDQAIDRLVCQLYHLTDAEIGTLFRE
ncbi:HsdM family class I SAM-dependent methyltransferase [Egbenema bharatensis]|uniref:HsdM family class I SAM-dependent methyltransferase n=1 Tax=Egbenema bharatensis TaxID=3463334 RepID=UPI003A835341